MAIIYRFVFDIIILFPVTEVNSLLLFYLKTVNFPEIEPTAG